MCKARAHNDMYTPPKKKLLAFSFANLRFRPASCTEPNNSLSEKSSQFFWEWISQSDEKHFLGSTLTQHAQLMDNWWKTRVPPPVILSFALFRWWIPKAIDTDFVMAQGKEVWSKRLVRLVQDSFRIGSDLNESHWFRIGSGTVPCLQGYWSHLHNRYHFVWLHWTHRYPGTCKSI